MWTTRRGAWQVPLGGVLALGTAARAQGIQQVIEERRDLEAVFGELGLPGCFVLHDSAADRLTIVNPDRARKRFVPASSFKIANSLIALETGVIRDENEVIPAGNGPKSVKAWEKDASIREGIVISHVPIFQELARRIGFERYRVWLQRLNYGNGQTGKVIDRFWLDGPLAISAVEQAFFASKLAEGKLDISSRSQAITRDILRLETANGATLYGKTGWSSADAPSIAWWVGWVEREGKVASFAMNITGSPIADGARRLATGKALLSKLGVY